MKNVQAGPYSIGEKTPFTLVSGPCVIESLETCLEVAEVLAQLKEKLNIQVFFKSSFDKANRTSIDSFRGPGIEKGLEILEIVRERTGLPIFTDVHTPEQALRAGAVCDIIQIPAFLSRQTDLLLAAGESKACVNIKKAQFMAPWDMEHPIGKVLSTGNENILLTDRGTMFGYNQQVSDMRSIPIMKNFGYPVLFDATHSVQLPGAQGSYTGGQREFVPTLSLASLAAGANGIYMESHPCPEKAKSDATTCYPLDEVESLVIKMLRIYHAVREE